MRPNFHLQTVCRAAGFAALWLAAAAANAQPLPTPEQLVQRLDALAQELERVKAQLQQLRESRDRATTVPPQADAAAAPAAAAAMPAAVAPAAPSEPSTVISSYGEINVNRPKNGSNTRADLARFVIALQHRFDEKTKMVSELEIEHAVSSADDRGEAEVEQLYLEHRLTDTYGARAGLTLVPIGLLNTNHEPTAYYGVERNFVETAIIPTTWREGGFQIFGEHDNGVSWIAGVGTGFDLSKWDATSSEGRESPLGSIHQELQLAKAHDVSVYGNVEWRGVPGLRLGGGGFTGKVGQATPGFAAPDARVTLWDVHAKWMPGPWDLSALYTKGAITGAGDLNLTFAGQPFPVPRSFDGWYAQAAYRWQVKGDVVLAPFARYERFNTGRSFDGLPEGLNPGNVGTEGVATLGASFYLNPNVVFKADVQRFRLNKDNDRFNLGVGYSF